MKLLALVSLALFVSACATQAGSGRCDLSADELAVLKENVRSYLRDELGDAYIYYTTEDSILDTVVNEDDSCGILIYPAGDFDDGSSLLHGEGIVLFDPAALTPVNVEIFVW